MFIAAALFTIAKYRSYPLTDEVDEENVTDVHIYTVGKGKLAKMVWSGSLTPGPLALTPQSVNNDYVRAEITYGTPHACHKALAWSQMTLCHTPA